MRSTRPAIVIVLLSVGLLGAYWAVSHAQERQSFFAPPPTLPPDERAQPVVPPAPKAPVKYPFQTQPLSPKPKADPTLIIPAAVYDVPRPIHSGKAAAMQTVEAKKVIVVEENPGLVPVGGVQQGPLPAEGGANLPPPMFPSMPVVAGPTPLPALSETKPIGQPIPEPTKALVLDPPAKPTPIGGNMIVEPSNPLQAPPALIPAAIVSPAPGRESVVASPVQPAPPALIPGPIVSPMPAREPIAAPPVRSAPPAFTPAPIVSPGPARETVVAPPVQQANAKPKSFVRIRTEEPRPATGFLPPPPLVDNSPVQQAAKFPQPLGVEPVRSASANLQTPSVSVDKRGPTAVRAGETVTYQIVVRNLGPAAAQQIRVEDEFPPAARFITAEPMPIMQSNKVVWTLTGVPPNEDQILRLTLQAGSTIQAMHHTSVQVSAASQANTVTVLRPQNIANALAIQLVAPNQITVGKPAVFEIRVVNHGGQPLTGIVLHGFLPPGLDTPQGRTIEGEVGGAIQPGDAKTLRLPTTAVQAGRFTVEAKVTTQSGQEASATTTVDITANSLQVQQPPSTRLIPGRDGDLRIEVTNNTGRPLRNVAIADRLPEGLEFVLASERGLFQANSRTVHWLLENLPVGATRTLVVRVHGTKAGQVQNLVTAKADGVAEVQCAGAISMQAVADLSLRVNDKDHLLEIGRETVYEILVQNPGNVSANEVRVRVQFPPGLTPRTAEGDTKFSVDRQTIAFEPIASLGPQEKAIYRVSAVAQATGDQRVRFAVVSDQVQVPIQREISTLVYRD